MKLSRLGAKFTEESGILQLMHDLGDALAAGDDILMLGGGNPARIPEVEAIFTERLRRLLSGSDEIEKLLASYDAPAGNRAFTRSDGRAPEGTLRLGGWPRERCADDGESNVVFLFVQLARR